MAHPKDLKDLIVSLKIVWKQMFQEELKIKYVTKRNANQVCLYALD